MLMYQGQGGQSHDGQQGSCLVLVEVQQQRGQVIQCVWKGSDQDEELKMSPVTAHSREFKRHHRQAFIGRTWPKRLNVLRTQGCFSQSVTCRKTYISQSPDILYLSCWLYYHYGTLPIILSGMQKLWVFFFLQFREFN